MTLLFNFFFFFEIYWVHLPTAIQVPEKWRVISKWLRVLKPNVKDRKDTDKLHLKAVSKYKVL